MLTSVVGINWGDEGKGRMVDLLSCDYEIVVRYQGGNNAGHTVVCGGKKFVMNLLPSGILRNETVNILGPGMVIDLEHLNREIEAIEKAGIRITPEHLVLSSRATICLPFHSMLDGLEEDRLGSKKFGSTRRGISPAYADKYMKKSLRMADLFYPGTLENKVRELTEWKNLTIEKGYGSEAVDTESILRWLDRFGKPLVPYIKDTTVFLRQASEAGKSVLFEAQLGALRDIDFGIYPYTSASSTLAAYAPIGAGIPFARPDQVIGIMKAYSSCVGEGPFTVELFGKESDRLREAGAEYGAATGRPRRVGAFDAVASRYGVQMQGCNCIALTKLDILSYLDKIPVCTAYEINGNRTEQFPASIEELFAAKPVYEYFPGFCTDIGSCRTYRALPKEAQEYIRVLEEMVSCRIRYVSVGAERDACIKIV